MRGYQDCSPNNGHREGGSLDRQILTDIHMMSAIVLRPQSIILPRIVLLIDPWCIFGTEGLNHWAERPGRWSRWPRNGQEIQLIYVTDWTKIWYLALLFKWHFPVQPVTQNWVNLTFLFQWNQARRVKSQTSSRNVILQSQVLAVINHS